MTPYGSAHIVMAALALLLALGHLALFVVLREKLQAIFAIVFFAFAVTDYSFGAASRWSMPGATTSTPMLLLTLGAFALVVAFLPMVPWVLFKRRLEGPRLWYLVASVLVVGGRTVAALWDLSQGSPHTVDELWSPAFSWAIPSALVTLSLPVEWFAELLAARRRREDRGLVAILGVGALMGLGVSVHALLVALGTLDQPLFLGMGGFAFLFTVSGYLGRMYVQATRRASGIGGYEILSPLGAGGMGETFIAVRKGLEGFSRRVVLKKMRAEGDPTERARFLSEAKLAATLRHPNIVDVLDLGELDGGGLFIAMEHIEGVTVSQLARAAHQQERALSPAVVAAIGAQLCKGLCAAHKQGVLHRDIKRANVMVSVDGVVKLIDFGLAQRPTTEKGAPMAGLEKLSGGLTQRSHVIGTPGYLAPERLTGEPATVASDLFAVGVVLYELLAGHRPFEALDGNEDPQALLEGRHRPLDEIRRDVPKAMTGLIEQCLAVDPKKRPADAEVLGRGLAAAIDIGQVDLGVLVREVAAHEPAGAEPARTTPGDSADAAVRAEAPTTPYRR